MATTITIRDASTSIEHDDRVFTLEMPAESMTVRELIRERVYQEVDDHNRAVRERVQAPRFTGLVQPEPAERELNAASERAKRPREIDWKRQFQAATKAYENNQFIVLVGEQQTTSLEQTIELTPSTEVVFLRLVLLVGG